MLSRRVYADRKCTLSRSGDSLPGGWIRTAPARMPQTVPTASIWPLYCMSMKNTRHRISLLRLLLLDDYLYRVDPGDSTDYEGSRFLKSFRRSASLSSVLRRYQTEGFQWIHLLRTFGFGGILADEMGLGKTLQVIAVLLSGRSWTRPSISKTRRLLLRVPSRSCSPHTGWL